MFIADDKVYVYFVFEIADSINLNYVCYKSRTDRCVGIVLQKYSFGYINGHLSYIFDWMLNNENDLETWMKFYRYEEKCWTEQMNSELVNNLDFF